MMKPLFPTDRVMDFLLGQTAHQASMIRQIYFLPDQFLGFTVAYQPLLQFFNSCVLIGIFSIPEIRL